MAGATNADDFRPTLEQAKNWQNMGVFERIAIVSLLLVHGFDVKTLERKYAEKLAEAN